MLTKLQEIAKQKGKELLIESFNIYSKNIKVIDKSSKRNFVESVEGEDLECLAIVRDIDISRYTENENGRIYNRKLWENVADSGVAEGTYCLANHPEDDDDGSVKDIIGVWHNFRITDDGPIADLYILDVEDGRRLLKALKAGGQVGISTVGFGEYLEDEITVNPETYELVRAGDWVLFPSQGVYATTENIKESNIHTNKETQKENRESTNKIIQYKENKIRGIESMDSTEKMLIGNYRNQAKSLLRESRKAVGQKNISKIIEYKEKISDFLEEFPSDLESLREEKSRISEHLEEVNEFLRESLEDSNKRLAANTQEFEKLKENYKTSNEVLKSLKEKHNKAKKVISVFSENDKLMREDIDRAAKKILVMEKQIKTATQNSKLMESDMKRLISERGDMLDDIKNLLEDKSTLLSDQKHLKEDRQTMLSDIKKFTELVSSKNKENKALRETVKKLRKKLSEMEDGDIEFPHEDYDDPDDVREDYYGDDTYDIAVDDAIAYQIGDEDQGAPYSGDDYELDDYQENRKPKAKVKRKVKMGESKKKVAPKREVMDYYLRESKKTPGLREDGIRNLILRSKSLVEAINKVDAYRSKVDTRPIQLKQKFRENAQIGWLKNSR